MAKGVVRRTTRRRVGLGVGGRHVRRAPWRRLPDDRRRRRALEKRARRVAALGGLQDRLRRQVLRPGDRSSDQAGQRLFGGRQRLCGNRQVGDAFGRLPGEGAGRNSERGRRGRRRRRRGRGLRGCALGGGLGPQGARAARGAGVGDSVAEAGPRPEDRCARLRARRRHHRLDRRCGRCPDAVHAWRDGRARGGGVAAGQGEPRRPLACVLPPGGGEALHAGTIPRHLPAPEHLVFPHDGQLLGGRPRRLPLERRPRRCARGISIRLRVDVH
mmetsp:Transcript_37712/g.113944  ORF Transcript_37712/g.113944 Transcript_37712/m.113944 type:complete len:272 (+) Transcript_37712:1435-2250(+)